MKFKFSKPGQHHKNDSLKNEDFVVIDENERFNVMTLCDGVSTCSQSKIGAEIAAKAMTEIFMEAGGFLENFNVRKRTDTILGHIKNKLQKEAEKENIDIEDMSSTVSSVLIDYKTKKIMYFLLGDSMLLIKKRNTYEIIVKQADPFYGCPVTTTKNAFRFVQTDVMDADTVEACWLFSDGAWHAMFTGANLSKNVETYINNNACESLSTFLDTLNLQDDYSFTMESY